MGIWTKIKQALGKTKEIASEAIEKADDILEDVGEKAIKKGAELYDKMDDIGEKIEDHLEKAGDVVKEKGKDIIEKAEEMGEKIGEKVEEKWDSYKSDRENKMNTDDSAEENTENKE
jgi:ElaB/YqjD/DUF883 family membrane-anchored ribosome-binding protein